MSVTATTISKARENIKKYTDDVAEYNDVLLITRPKGKNVVLVSEQAYNSWQETEYLLSSEENREALEISMNQLKKGETKMFTPEQWESFVKEHADEA